MPKIPDVKIGISVGVAAFRRDWKTVLQIVADSENVRVRAARNTATQVDKSAKQEASSVDKAERAKAKAAERSAKEKIAAYKQADLYERQARKAAEREVAESERKKAREARRWMQERKRQEEEMARHQFAIREKYARTVGYGYRAGTQAIRTIGMQAVSVMGGFSFADTVRGRAAESGLAANIALQGSKKGSGNQAGTKFHGSEVLNAATSVGVESGLGTHATLEALDVFTKKSGDLGMGLKTLKDIAIFADASGTELRDLAGASAELFSSGTVKNGEELQNILGSILEMGKDGAVELSDLAVGFGRITSSAGQFEGNKMENVKKLTAFAEMSKKYAAASPREALTSISNFASDIAKHSGGFSALGVNVNDQTGKFLKDPFQILEETFKKSGGLSTQQQHKLFGERSFRAIAGASEIYNKARTGGDTHEQAWAKVMKEFGELLEGQATPLEAAAQAAERRAESDRKAAKAMEELKAKVGDSLLPILPKLADSVINMIPTMVKLSDAIVAVADIMTAHPWAGLGAVVAGYIGAEIAKAKIAEIISALIVGKAPGTAGAFTGANGAKNAAGGGVVATSLALTAATAGVIGGTETVINTYNQVGEAIKKTEGDDALFQRIRSGKGTPDDIEAAKKKLAEMKEMDARTRGVSTDAYTRFSYGIGSAAETGINAITSPLGLEVPEYFRAGAKQTTDAWVAQNANLPQAIDNLSKVLEKNISAIYKNIDASDGRHPNPVPNQEHRGAEK